MARSTSQVRPRKPRKKSVTPSAAPVSLETQTTVDPNLDRRLGKLLVGFTLRMGLLYLIVGIIVTFGTTVSKLPTGFAQGVVFASAFGVMIPFWRGIDRVFGQIREIGRERLKQQRYADAKLALEYFHRVGNMGFDRYGEAHFLLTQAYLGLNDMESAEKMVVWLEKNRKRFEWPQKAADVVQSARKAKARAELKNAIETEGLSSTSTE